MDHQAWSDGQDELGVTVDGHELTAAYREFEEGSGPPVIFLHGIPTWSYLWRDIAPEIGSDHRVIVPDLVGYGNSSMADQFDRSVRAQEQVLDQMIDELTDGEVVLVAHDIGGGAAIRYAAHNSDRVAGLVMSNAVCYDSWPVEFISDLGLPETADAPVEQIEKQVGGAFEAGVYEDEADPEFVEGMVAPWLSEEGVTSLSRCAVSTNTNHTTELDYDAIETELLCLWGTEDTFQPIEYGEQLVEDLGGEMVELDAYHWVPYDRAEEYVDHLREFLTETLG
jgi:pimeloyl-ACP methyl ester carboxylesterase